ncbi:hypothetical protein SAY86_028954 [Trapa natans]|uniref:Uncharacterized protein n=1 Tax=Trapa natans TaxID=22666 RepID=A0AAN7MJT8_TRANT|nr:hypothetical protein SAY86_028954 [Trapa natans]
MTTQPMRNAIKVYIQNNISTSLHQRLPVKQQCSNYHGLLLLGEISPFSSRQPFDDAGDKNVEELNDSGLCFSTNVPVSYVSAGDFVAGFR